MMSMTSVQKQEIVEQKLDEKFNAVFLIDGKTHRFTKESLYCLDQDSRFRKFFVRIIVNKWFDRFITFCIVVNSLLLASKEYYENYDAKYDSLWNKILD